jgi:hypothetical protein
MIYYDEAARGQIAAERIERIADDYARANVRHRRRDSRWELLLAAALKLVERARRSAQRPQLEA